MFALGRWLGAIRRLLGDLLRRFRSSGALGVDAGGDPYGDLSARYTDLAVQYFVTARGAFFWRCMEVSAINFHHSLEMLLNARLLEEFSSNELQEKFKHNLPKLWREFKKVVGKERKVNLGVFDSVINELHKWEGRRYPNSTKGAFMAADFRKSLQRSGIKQYFKNKKNVQVPRYYFTLEAMDELFNEVVNAYPLNPEFLRTYMYEGVSVYERENAHPIWVDRRADVGVAAQSGQQAAE